MKLYHWTLNAKKILENGFNESIWVTCTLLQPSGGVHKGMKLITIDMPLEDTEPYEESNEGPGYKAFNIPPDIANKYVIKSPIVYRDRGIYRTNE